MNVSYSSNNNNNKGMIFDGRRNEFEPAPQLPRGLGCLVGLFALALVALVIALPFILH